LVPVDQLKLSAEVPQFKRGAIGGIIKPLEGKFEATGVGPIQVWRRLNGDLEVISGRHRWDLAKRSGLKSISAQIHDEAKGFTAKQAAKLDAELNIRDEQGSIADFAVFFRNSDLTDTEAKDRGYLQRQKGQQGWSIGKYASDDVFAAHQAGRINDAAAAAVAAAAPNNTSLQAVGLKAALEGKNADFAGNLVKAYAGKIQEKQTGGEAFGDLFGFDDSAIKESEQEAELVSKIQRDIREDIRSVRDAARFPQRAQKYGVNVKKPETVLAAVRQLEAELAQWDGSWFMDPNLKAKLKQMKESGQIIREQPVKQTTKVEPTPVPAPPKVEPPTVPEQTPTPFQTLRGESVEDLLQQGAKTISGVYTTGTAYHRYSYNESTKSWEYVENLGTDRNSAVSAVETKSESQSKDTPYGVLSRALTQEEILGKELTDFGYEKIGFGKNQKLRVRDVYNIDPGWAAWAVEQQAKLPQMVRIQQYLRKAYPDLRAQAATEQPAAAEVLTEKAVAVLKNHRLSAKVNNKNQIVVTGATYGWKDYIKSNQLGRFDGEGWVFEPSKFGSFVEHLAGVDIGQRPVQPTRDGDTRLTKLRETADGLPDRSGFTKPVGEYIEGDTVALLRKGENFGIPKAVVDEQIEDVALINRAYQENKKLFLLASAPGTGKTFVLGAAIRELRKSGAKTITYVTLRQELISQIQSDLAAYGIGDVNFVTYPSLMKAEAQPTDVLIFDEAHAIKNSHGSSQGKAAQELIQKAKYTVFSSATPFENPVQAEYLEPTGIFSFFGSFKEFALAYGATKYKESGGKTLLIWKRTKTSNADQVAAREYIRKQGVFTARRTQLPPQQVDSRFVKIDVSATASDNFAAFQAAVGRTAGRMRLPGFAKAWIINFSKRLMEAAKVQTAINEAESSLARGRWPIIFVETKAERTINIPDLLERENDWRIANGTRDPGEASVPRSAYGLPPSGITEVMEEFMRITGITKLEIPSAEDLIVKHFGVDKTAVFTGSVTNTVAERNLAKWRGPTPTVLIATMAKGGTGLSLHDKVGDHPTTQINLNLPWTATQVEQVSLRSARYGLVGTAEMQWLFAENIALDKELAARVGARMADMGAMVHGQPPKVASTIEDWDMNDQTFSEEDAEVSPEVPASNVPTNPVATQKSFLVDNALKGKPSVTAAIQAVFDKAVNEEFTKHPETLNDSNAREAIRNEVNKNPDALAIIDNDPEASAIIRSFLKENGIPETSKPSFEQLLQILGTDAKFSKTKILKSMRRAVDISALQRRAQQLGVERLVRFGQAVAGIQAFYDTRNDEVVFVTSNLDGTDMAIRKLYHELTERNLVFLGATEKGRAELRAILAASRTELMASLPSVLKETGYKTLDELKSEYGFENENELLGELLSRYAERLADKPKPSWWKTLLAKVQFWLAKHLGVNITPAALEHWLAGNIEKFAAASPGASGTTTKAETGVTLRRPRTSEELLKAYKYSKSKSARSFQERLQEVEGEDLAVQMEVVPELIVNPEGAFGESSDLWDVLNAAGSAIQSYNERQNHIVNLVSRLNLNRLSLSGNTDVTVTLVESIDGENGLRFDPVTNVITVAADVQMSHQDLVAGLLNASFQAALHNLVTNGIPQIDPDTKAQSDLATKEKALSLLKEARNTYDPKMDLADFVSQSFNTGFRNALFGTSKPGKPNSNAGRYLMDSLYTLLGVDKESSIAEETARVMEAKPEVARIKAQERAKAAMAQGNKKTEALKRYLKANPELQARLKESSYNSQTNAQVLDNVNGWIAQFNGDFESAAVALESKSTTAPLRPHEITLARVFVARKLDAMAQIAESIDEPYEAEYYRNLSTEQHRKAQMELSQGGQLLNVGSVVAGSVSPNTIEEDMVNPISETQKDTIGTDSTTQAIETDVRTTTSETAADKTTDKAKDVIDKATGAKSVDADLKDAVDELEKDELSDEDLIEKVAKYIVRLTMKRLTGGVKAPTKLDIEAYLKKVVKEQLADKITILRTNTKAPIKAADLLVENLELAEVAFEKSRKDLLEKTPLSAEQRQEVLRAKFRDYNYGKVKTVLKKSLNLRAMVRTSLQDQQATLGSFIQKFVDASGLSVEDGTRVARAIAEVYNQEARAEAAKQLSALSKSRKAGSRVKIDEFQKLLAFFNLGAFNTKELYNALAQQNPELNLPSYDAEFVKDLKTQAAQVQAMPESDVKQEKAMLLMTRIAQRLSQELKGKAKAKFYALEVAPAIWKAGVLSGIPTQAVNALGSFSNVGVNGVLRAFGYQVKALKSGKTSFVESFEFYKDVFRSMAALTGMFDNATPYNIVLQQAAEMGKTRFTSYQSEQLGVLEQLKDRSVLGKLTFMHRWVGRMMAMADGINTQLGYEINQRHAFRYAMTMDPSLITEGDLMSAFDPDTKKMAEINAQIAAEKLTGRDADLRRQGLIEQYRQELTGDPEYLAKSLEPALEWTFNAMPKGLIGAFFEGFAATARRMTLGISDYFLPFMRTVASITNSCVDFFPLYGFVRAYNVSPSMLLMGEDNKYRPNIIEPGSVEHTAQLARATIGTGIFAAFMILVFKGLREEEEGEEPFFAIYGSGPTGFLKRNEWIQAGFRPRTLRFGNNYIPYNDLPGLSLMLGAIGTVSDTYRFVKNKDEREPLELPKLALLGIVNTLFEKNLLSGVANLLEIIQNVDQRGLIGVDRLVTSTVSGFTNPSLVKFMGDQLFRTDSEGRLVTTDSAAQEAFLYAMTPMSFGYNKPALDVFGEPITQGRFEPLTRRFFSLGVGKHPIFSPLITSGLIVPTPSRSTQFMYKGKKHTFSIDNELYRRFVELRGQHLAKVLTPQLAEKIASISKTANKQVAQDILNRIASVSRQVAVRRVQAELYRGTLKSNRLNGLSNK